MAAEQFHRHHHHRFVRAPILPLVAITPRVKLTHTHTRLVPVPSIAQRKKIPEKRNTYKFYIK